MKEAEDHNKVLGNDLRARRTSPVMVRFTIDEQSRIQVAHQFQRKLVV